MTYIDTSLQDLGDRTKYLGSSDFPILMGVSPYMSEVQLYLQKRGSVESTFEPTERMLAGSYMEHSICAFAADQYGWDLRRVETATIHPEHDFIQVHVDRVLYFEGVPIAVVEVKNIDKMFMKAWVEEGVPLYYQIQVLSQSACIELPGLYLVCFGGNEMKLFGVKSDQDDTTPYEIEPSEAHDCLIRFTDKENALIGKGLEFWGKVERGEMPDVDGSEDCAKALSSIFNDPSKELVEIGDRESVVELASMAQHYGKAAKEAEEQATLYKNRLRVLIGDNYGITMGDRGKVTWGMQKGRNGFDTKGLLEKHPEIHAEFATEGNPYRVLRINLKKGGAE